MNITFDEVDPASLQAHTCNANLYGDDPIDELTEQIRQGGWIKPLVVTRGNIIVSGHRRWRAALELGLKSVPIEHRDFSNELEELEMILLENQYREKTNEQKTREAAAWEEVERERARARKLATLKQGTFPDQENFPDREKQGQTRDLVAQRVGWSGRTYEKARSAVKAIDKAKLAGDLKGAEQLRKVLNEESVDKAAKIAAMPKTERTAELKKATAKPPKVVETIARCEELEFYTPQEYVASARRVMGKIDLDPASSEKANKTIKAKQYFDFDTNGLVRPWHGRVFLNPPHSGQEPWIKKLLDEYQTEHVQEAILLINAVNGSKWTKPLWDFLACILDHPIKAHRPNGSDTEPLRGYAFIYFGPKKERFAKVFGRFGDIVTRFQAQAA